MPFDPADGLRIVSGRRYFNGRPGPEHPDLTIGLQPPAIAELADYAPGEDERPTVVVRVFRPRRSFVARWSIRIVAASGIGAASLIGTAVVGALVLGELTPVLMVLAGYWFFAIALGALVGWGFGDPAEGGHG